MRRLLAALTSTALLAAACGGTTATTSTTTLPPTTTTTTLPPTPQTAGQAGLPWWNDRVFYEVFVRSFADSDGDGIGDLQGLIERLDYLNDGDPATTDDLGITGIWLMPVFESPSYHGYDVTDYRAVDPDYGTIDDLRAFVDAAHERGIAVILDLVINHTSVEHPWFAASAAGDEEYADWYVWSDTHPGWVGPWGQQVWHTEGGRFYYGLFWEGMPDLNLENPAVTAEMLDIAAFWLDEVGVDGYRLDAARHYIEEGEYQESTPSTLEWLAGLQESVPDDALLLGEVWTTTDVVARYIPESLDLAFEFDLSFGTLQGVATGSASLVSDALQRVVDAYPPGQYAVFLSNHDQARVMSQLSTSWPKATEAATLLLTYPGVPFVYYGEELGMNGRKPDPRLRTPMPWTDEEPGVGFTTGVPWEEPQPGASTVNVAAETDDPGSLLSRYRDLIRLREEHPALRFGDTIVLGTGSRTVVAYLRTIGDDHVLVVANLGIGDVEEYGLTLAAGGPDLPVEAVMLLGDGEPASPEIDGAGGFTEYRPFESLPARTAVVIELSEIGV